MFSISNFKLPIKCLSLSLLVSASLLPLTIYSQIRVKKAALRKNPSISSRGISGSPALTAKINNNLKNCGWFDVKQSGKTDYILKGSLSGSNLKVTIYRGNGTSVFSYTIKANTKNPERTSRQAVDYILKKQFQINQLCMSKIVFCAQIKTGFKEIYIADYDGSNVRQITKNRSLSVEPDWEPGQKRLVYTMYSKMFTDIVEYDLASRRSRRLIHFPGLNAGASVSRDGRYFAVILSKDGKVDLYIKSLNTKWIKKLTNSTSSESSPCWSPSGGKICFVSDRSRRPNLYVISARGGKAQRLPTLGTEAVSPDWSSDNKIIYSAKMGRNYAIALLDLNGKEPARIVVSAAGDWESPSWAPDNRHVVASRTFQGRSDIYVIDTWTGKAKRILAGKIPFSLPSW